MTGVIMMFYVYLAIQKISVKDAAKELGVTRQYLHRVINGEICGRKLAEKIVIFCRGHVSLAEVHKKFKNPRKLDKTPKLKQLDAFDDRRNKN